MKENHDDEYVDHRLGRALRSLRLSGMTETLQARALQVDHNEMDFIEAFAQLAIQRGYKVLYREAHR